MQEVARADMHVHNDKAFCGQIFSEAEQSNTTLIGLLDRNTVNRTELASMVKKGKDRFIDIVPGMELLLKQRDPSMPEFTFEFICLDFDLNNQGVIDQFDPKGAAYSQVHFEKVQFQRDYLQREVGLNTDVVAENQAIWQPIESMDRTDTAILICRMAVQNPANELRIEQLRAEEVDQIAAHEDTRKEDKGDLAKYLYWAHFATGKGGHRLWGQSYQPKFVLDVIHEAGGFAVLAHPGYQHNPDTPNPRDYLDYFLSLGLDGVEAWDAGDKDIELVKYALSRGKLALGGSGRDFRNYNNRIIGLGDIDKRDMFMDAQQTRDHIRKYKQKAGLPEVYLKAA